MGIRKQRTETFDGTFLPGEMLNRKI